MTPTIPTAEPEAPEDQEQAFAAPDYGQNFREMPQEVIDCLKQCIIDYQGQDKWARRREVRRDRRNRFYDEGYQFLSWNSGATAGYSILTPGAWVSNPTGGSIQCPQYMDAYNVFHAYLWVIMAVVTSLPGIKFEPKDPSREEDKAAAKSAEGYSKKFDRHNDVLEIVRQIIRMLGLSGRTVSWTRTELDAEGSGRPYQCTDILGTLETKVPITCKKFQDFPYAFLYRDFDITYLRGKYDWIKDKIKAGTAALEETQFDRTARLGVLSGSRAQGFIGDSLEYISTEGHYFLRPVAFAAKVFEKPFAEEGSEGQTVGDWLKENFPKGIRAVFVGDAYAEAFPESMDEHLNVQHPFPGDGQFRTAFMDPAIVVQDNVNDLCNWAREKFDTGAGSTWTSQSQTEIDAITSQRAAPNAIRPMKLAASTTSVKDNIYQEPDPELKASFVEWMQMLQGPFLQFILAAPPALFGESMPDQKTASGYAQAKNQATGRLGMLYGRVQAMFAAIRYQAAILAAEAAPDDTPIIVVGPDGQNVSVDLQAIQQGEFGCYPDEDSSFPESIAQKRGTLVQLINMLAPLAAGDPQLLLEFLNPDNMETILELLGFAELKLPSAEAADKQNFEIEELLKGTPLLAPAQAAAVDPATGQPLPPPLPEPSIPIGPLDDNAMEFRAVQIWVNSQSRREADSKPNEAEQPELDQLCAQFACKNYGVLNVILHGMKHQAAIPPPPAPPMMPPKALPPGGPGKPASPPAAAGVPEMPIQ